MLKPYITPGILKSINRKHVLFQKYKSTTCVHDFENYNKYKKVLDKIILKSKSNFYEQTITELDSSKKLWNWVNSQINNKTKNTSYTILTPDGKLTENDKDTATTFAKHFSTIGSRVAEKIKPTDKSYNDYLREPNKNSFFFLPTNDAQVNKIIEDLKLNKSYPINDIPTKVIKQFPEIFASHINFLFNASIQKGCFPEIFKLGQVTPIFKKRIQLLLRIIGL